MIHRDTQTLAVQATFKDCIAAEIACAILSEASLDADEPEATGLRSWLVRVRGLTPSLARRAEAVLRRAGATDAKVISNEALGDLRADVQGLPGLPSQQAAMNG